MSYKASWQKSSTGKSTTVISSQKNNERTDHKLSNFCSGHQQNAHMMPTAIPGCRAQGPSAMQKSVGQIDQAEDVHGIGHLTTVVFQVDPCFPLIQKCWTRSKLNPNKSINSMWGDPIWVSVCFQIQSQWNSVGHSYTKFLWIVVLGYALDLKKDWPLSTSGIYRNPCNFFTWLHQTPIARCLDHRIYRCASLVLLPTNHPKKQNWFKKRVLSLFGFFVEAASIFSWGSIIQINQHISTLY